MKYYLFIGFLFFSSISFAQFYDAEDGNTTERLNKYDKAIKTWSVGAILRSDGLGFNFNYTHGKRIRASMLYQLELGYYTSLSQTRQRVYIENVQFKRFTFGKINNLLALHINVGQKILLAERARKNGVRIYTHYAAGFSLGILKPYMLKVVDTASLLSVGPNQYTFSEVIDVAYENGKNESYFLNVIPFAGGALAPIVGGSGFGKGWNLSFQPGIHLKGGFSFDWSRDEGVIKGLDIGFSCDVYFKKVPVMLINNKQVYPSVYAGFQIGKRKR